MNSNLQLSSSESGNSASGSPNEPIYSSPSPSNFECSENINNDYDYPQKKQKIYMSPPQLVSTYNNYNNNCNGNYNNNYNNYNNYHNNVCGVNVMMNPVNAEDYVLTQQLQQLRQRNAFMEQYIEKEQKSFEKVQHHLTKKIASSQRRYDKNLKEYVENINKQNKTQQKITEAGVDQKIQQIAQIERNFQQQKQKSAACLQDGTYFFIHFLYFHSFFFFDETYKIKQNYIVIWR